VCNIFRKQAEAHKYWFYLYNVVNSYLEVNEGSEPIPASRVISVLRDFMEKSNLVEYEVRLDIIYVYHCHLVHLEPSNRRGIYYVHIKLFVWSFVC
jgi:hypothetical protein